jgi:hypothetical protein
LIAISKQQILADSQDFEAANQQGIPLGVRV